MKKILLMGLFVIALSGCSSDNLSSGDQSVDSVLRQSSEKSNSPGTSKNERVLVAYFSESETDGIDVSAGASRVTDGGELYGITQLIARWISEETDGELFQIKPAAAYPGNHDKLVDQADQELAEKARPELAEEIKNLADYDTVFIGYPIWWSDLPMPMYTFFENTDFKGKKVIPFSTHGGSGMAGTQDTVKELASETTVETKNTLTVSRNDVADSKDEVTKWLDSLGYEY